MDTTRQAFLASATRHVGQLEVRATDLFERAAHFTSDGELRRTVAEVRHNLDSVPGLMRDLSRHDDAAEWHEGRCRLTACLGELIVQLGRLRVAVREAERSSRLATQRPTETVA